MKQKQEIEEITNYNKKHQHLEIEEQAITLRDREKGINNDINFQKELYRNMLKNQVFK